MKIDSALVDGPDGRPIVSGVEGAIVPDSHTTDIPASMHAPTSSAPAVGGMPGIRAGSASVWGGSSGMAAPATSQVGGIPRVPAPPTTPQPIGMMRGPNGATARILTDAEVIADIEKESPGLHIGVFGIGLVLCLVLSAVAAGGAAAAAIGAGIGVFIALFFTIPINTAAAWLVGKMFGQDFGSFPVLLLHVGAVTALYTAVMTGASIVMGPMMSMLLSFPVMLVLALWLLGMDMFQSMVFTVVISGVKMVLTTLIIGSVASMFAMGSSDISDMGMWDENGEFIEFDGPGEFYYDDEGNVYVEDW